MVNTHLLDHLLDKSKRYKLINIDVEGAEAKVIRWAKTVIAESRPIIVLEWSGIMLEQLGDSTDELWSILAGVGYSIYLFSGGTFVLATREQLAMRQMNVVTLPDEHANLLLSRLPTNG